MSVLRIIFSIAMIVDSVVLTAVVLFQQGRDQNLGAISGAAEMIAQSSIGGEDKSKSVWKKRTPEARLKKATIICSVAFFVIAVLLNMSLF